MIHGNIERQAAAKCQTANNTTVIKLKTKH